jgi:hypothetical protein
MKHEVLNEVERGSVFTLLTGALDTARRSKPTS